jgi:hypothetical protein
MNIFDQKIKECGRYKLQWLVDMIYYKDNPARV